MSLIRCCECKKDVSEYAEKCPNCGCPIEVIKENSNLNRKTIFIELSQKELHLEFLEKELEEKELQDGDKVSSVLRNHGLSISELLTVEGILEFNNYKFPKDYQTCYEMMREHNASNRKQCPTCGSGNITRLGLIHQVAISPRTFKCKNCGYEW